MKSFTVSAVAAAALIMSTVGAMADASVSVDISSANVFRGATLNDGLVVQPAIEVNMHGLTLGVWGNLDLDDYDGAVEKNQFGEIDLYASYAIPVEIATLTLGYIEYAYPGSEENADREVNLGVGLDVILNPNVTVSYGVDGGVNKSWHVGAGIGHSIDLPEGFGLDLGATVAYVDIDGGESGFADYTVSASLTYGPFAAGVTYIGQIDDDVLPDGPGAYDVEWVGTLSVSLGL